VIMVPERHRQTEKQKDRRHAITALCLALAAICSIAR